MARLRWASQAIFLIAFLFLFLSALGPVSRSGPLWPGLPADLFLRLDPLVGLTTILSTHRWLPELALFALPVLGLTLLLGRVFCGWICPLGALIDLSDRAFFRRRRPKSPQLRRLKYYLLGAVLAAGLLGGPLVWLLDPVSLLTRSLTVGVFAPIQLLWRALGLRSGWLLPEDQSFFSMNWLALSVLVGVLAAGALSRRFWCRNLCPLGALLGLLSRAPLLARRVNERCNECLRCATECRMGAVTDGRRYLGAECISCQGCQTVCPQGAIRSFGPAGKERVRSLDLSRRRVLAFGAAGAGWAALAATSPGSKRSQTVGTKLSSPALIRPPGALPEEEFLERCLRCQQCVKVCPTNGLQPALSEAGVEGFFSPVLVSRIGACTQQCDACGRLCPTDAIQPFTIAEKEHLYLGIAIIDRSQCIAWYADKACLVCDEGCSYDAIEQRRVDGRQRPFVIERKCVGCGQCEYDCPIQPVAAIRVFSRGDRRDWGRARQRKWRAGYQQAEK